MSLASYFHHRAAEAEEDRQWYEDRPGNWGREREAEAERDYWRSCEASYNRFHSNVGGRSSGGCSRFTDDGYCDDSYWDDDED